MMSSYISTLAWTGSARAAIPRLQSEIARANIEIGTARAADVGLALGARTGESVSLHAAHAAIDTQLQNNAFAADIAARTQAAMSQISSTANTFLSDLLTSRSTTVNATTLAAQAQSALGALVERLNASDGQRYLFAGVNSATAPVNDYADGAQAEIKSAFAARFGLDATAPADDPAVAEISADDMAAFLDDDFAKMFEASAWGQTWSNASDQALTARISDNARVDIATTANSAAVRGLAMAYAMVAELGVGNLNSAARTVVLDKATSVMTSAITGLTAISARIGVSQSRITQSDEMLQEASSLIETRINAMEGVDPAEAKTRLDTLTTQLQMSYSTTAKLMQLSLLNYV